MIPLYPFRRVISAQLDCTFLLFIAEVVFGCACCCCIAAPSEGNATLFVTSITISALGEPLGKKYRAAFGNSCPYFVGTKLLSFVAILTDILPFGTYAGGAGPGSGNRPPLLRFTPVLNLSAKDILA